MAVAVGVLVEVGVLVFVGVDVLMIVGVLDGVGIMGVITTVGVAVGAALEKAPMLLFPGVKPGSPAFIAGEPL